MSDSNRIDDVMISAFVDNQIDAENREAIIKAIDVDEELREQVYQIRRAKDLMKLGFSESRPTEFEFNDTKFTDSLNRQCLLRIAAACSAIAIGLSSGYAGYNYGKSTDTVSNSVLASISQEQNENIIIHIDESDPKQFENTLVYTEKFLNKHKGNDKYRIEVVANAGGIDLLRDEFPLSEKIANMMDDYDNVTFIACTNAINKLRSQGIDPIMVKDVATDTAALTHIIDRLNMGWRYIKADSETLKAKTEALRI